MLCVFDIVKKLSLSRDTRFCFDKMRQTHNGWTLKYFWFFFVIPNGGRNDKKVKKNKETRPNNQIEKKLHTSSDDEMIPSDNDGLVTPAEAAASDE